MNQATPQRTIELLFALLIAIAISGWLIFTSTSTHWTGRATLSVEFCVSNAATGSPIHGAQIKVRLLDRGPDPANGVYAFTLTTDQHGRAIRVEQVSHAGKDAPLGIGNTQGADVPYWGAFTTAEGFGAVKMIAVGNLKQVPTGPATYRIDVPVRLQPRRTK